MGDMECIGDVSRECGLSDILQLARAIYEQWGSGPEAHKRLFDEIRGDERLTKAAITRIAEQSLRYWMRCLRQPTRQPQSKREKAVPVEWPRCPPLGGTKAERRAAREALRVQIENGWRKRKAAMVKALPR